MDKFRVNFIDGSFIENLSQEEADQIIKSPLKDWTSVTSMEYIKEKGKVTLPHSVVRLEVK